jgi:hypothetical protein
MTHPLRNTTRAVVKPTPPGQGPGKVAGSICANWLNVPLGAISTKVVPVPCKLELLLKLLMRIFPLVRLPAVRGIRKIPYGLTSPLAGMVEEIVLMV